MTFWLDGSASGEVGKNRVERADGTVVLVISSANNTSDIGNEKAQLYEVDKELLAFAETILDEMIQAESADEGDYQLFVKHFDKVDDFGPSRFKNELLSIREDLGDYKNRKYLGALKGRVDPDYPDRFPEPVRFNWCGIFAKNETLITLGLYKKEGEFVVREIVYR